MNRILKSLLPRLDLGWNRVRARCGWHACHNKLLMRPVPHRGTGIQMDESWYCSADCFSAAMRAPLEALLAEDVTEAVPKPRLSLGLAMLAKGFLTEEQLRFATARAEQRGNELEATLLELGLASDKHLTAARAAQWGCPVLAGESSAQPVKVDLPRTLFREFETVPLYFSAQSKRLVLGFVQRVDYRLLQSIEELTGCRAETCLLTPREFEEQMTRVSFPDDYEEIAEEKAATSAQMAKILGGVALEVSAKTASVVRCRAWVWVRVTGKRRTIDVLFCPRPSAPAAPAPRPRAEVIEFHATSVHPWRNGVAEIS
jgi:hypothetical protein